jgi:Cell Wall Hydrolase
MTYEQWLAALCLWREARGSSLQALTGIWNVLLNRVNDPGHRWSRTLPGVIMQPEQFSSFNKSDPNSVKFPMPPQPGNPTSPDWRAWLDCQTVVEVAIEADPTHGATNYVSVDKNGDIPEGAKAWATEDKFTVAIGAFRFYKL